jgi:hypothetical protein
MSKFYEMFGFEPENQRVQENQVRPVIEEQAPIPIEKTKEELRKELVAKWGEDKIKALENDIKQKYGKNS